MIAIGSTGRAHRHLIEKLLGGATRASGVVRMTTVVSAHIRPAASPSRSQPAFVAVPLAWPSSPSPSASPYSTNAAARPSHQPCGQLTGDEAAAAMPPRTATHTKHREPRRGGVPAGPGRCTQPLGKQRPRQQSGAWSGGLPAPERRTHATGTRLPRPPVASAKRTKAWNTGAPLRPPWP